MKKISSLPIIISAILLFVFSGCKRDKPDFSDPKNYINGGGPTKGSSGTDSTGTLSDTYFPVTKGTYWKYKSTTGTEIDTTTTTITGDSTTINGKVYYAGVTQSVLNGESSGYFYAGNHIYTQREDLEGNTIELEELDDSLPVDGIWTTSLTSDGTVNSVPGRLLGKIVEKGISRTVLGKTFANVIHTQLQIQYDYGLGDGFQTIETSDFYFAKGIGVIETDTVIPGFGTSTVYLISYSIK